MSENDHTKEFEMRDSAAPWPDNQQELLDYINSLVEQEHDYGTCVYAMSLAAVATFQYVAKKLGCTGFQSSMADLDILRRTRNMKGPFRILNYENLLYPQYCTAEHFPTILDLAKENIDWLAEQAEVKLAEAVNAHPNVREHWEMIIRTRAALKNVEITEKNTGEQEK